MFALAHCYAFVQQQETPTNSGSGEVIFSDLWGDWEGAKKKKKKGAPNKQTNDTDNFHLFKTERFSKAYNLLSHLQRNDISFPFPCFARTADGWGNKLK